uniref:interleukin-27 subunit beta n=1 Tax=Semicossyphus pulcher TaxID=241346 RepID=UPI0037E70949
MHYIATYSEKNRQITNQCHLIRPGSLSSASSSEQLWHCYLPNLKLLTDYIINVTAVYPSASSSQLTSFMLEDIVKPDPPVDIRVSPHDNGNLLVKWSPPSSWANLDIFPLKYQIVYQWDYRGSPKSVNLGPTESTKIELKGLTPGRQYLFQVCAKDLLGLGKFSDWSSPVNITIPRTKL